MSRHDRTGEINAALRVGRGKDLRRVRSRSKNPSHSRTPAAPPDQQRRDQDGR